MGGKDFAERFNLRIDEKTEFIKLRNRIAVLFRKGIVYELNHANDFLSVFTVFLGAEDYENWDFVGRFIEDTADLNDLLEHIEALFAALRVTKHDGLLKQAYDLVETAFALSRHIQRQMVKTKDEIIFYPKGAPLLDELLIEDVLNGLIKYPDANKAFNDAIRKYKENNPENNRNLLDDLRVSLEQILRNILKNKTMLEKQTPALTKWLEAKNINEQTIKNVCSLHIISYTNLQNEAVKHKIGIFTPPEIEYLIYQTGLFLRFLIELDK
jgi:tetratricopeptide (TPR) repeat protein